MPTVVIKGQQQQESESVIKDVNGSEKVERKREETVHCLPMKMSER